MDNAQQKQQQKQKQQQQKQQQQQRLYRLAERLSDCSLSDRSRASALSAELRRMDLSAALSSLASAATQPSGPAPRRASAIVAMHELIRRCGDRSQLAAASGRAVIAALAGAALEGVPGLARARQSALRAEAQAALIRVAMCCIVAGGAARAELATQPRALGLVLRTPDAGDALSFMHCFCTGIGEAEERALADAGGAALLAGVLDRADTAPPATLLQRAAVLWAQIVTHASPGGPLVAALLAEGAVATLVGALTRCTLARDLPRLGDSLKLMLLAVQLLAAAHPAAVPALRDAGALQVAVRVLGDRTMAAAPEAVECAAKAATSLGSTALAREAMHPRNLAAMAANNPELAMLASATPHNQCSCGNQPPPGAKFKECSKCKSASYCCKECQVAHWPQHKTQCKLLAAMMAT